MVERPPTVIIVKGIRPGVPAQYWQLSCGDMLVDYRPIEVDNDNDPDYLWNMRN